LPEFRGGEVACQTVNMDAELRGLEWGEALSQ
jgi:hypothetical protein